MTRPPAGRFLNPAVLFFLVVWLLFLLLFRERGFYDPGSLWHIRVGEIILTSGFPWTDPFTFTFAGHTWIPQQWGAEVLMALAHRVDGFDTLLLSFSVGVAGLYTWIFSRATRAGMSPLLAGMVVGGFLAAGVFHYVIRPHMFTIAFLAWTMASIIDFERGRAGLGRLAGLIPLYIVWTNLHGGVLGGTMTLGLAVGGWILLGMYQNWRQRRANEHNTEHAAQATGIEPDGSPVQSSRTAISLIAIVLSCMLTPFDNPFGLEMIHTWQRIVGSNVLKEVVSEHRPINLLEPTAPDKVVLCAGSAYLLLLAGVFPRRPRISWLLPLVWFGLTFQSIRQGPLFAVTAVLAVIDFWPSTVWYRLLKKYGDTLATEPEEPPRRIQWATLAIPSVVVAIALGLQVTQTPVPVVGHGWARLDPEMTPVDLNEEMQHYAASVPPGTHIFNDANLGGYLIYFTPTLKIFMDDRCELFGDTWISDYANTMAKEPKDLAPRLEMGWREKYGFDRAIVVSAPEGEEKPKIEQYLLSRPDLWKEVARGKRAVIFDRVP